MEMDRVREDRREARERMETTEKMGRVDGDGDGRERG
jgi:hypothetical protein